MSNLNLDILDKMSNEEIAALPVDALHDLQGQIASASALFICRKEKFWSAINLKWGHVFHGEFLDAGKDTGTVNIAADGGHIVTVEIKKTVKWSTSKLRAILEKMTPELAAHYGKVELSVDERKYTAAPPEDRAALEPARTVKPGKAVFTIS